MISLVAAEKIALLSWKSALALCFKRRLSEMDVNEGFFFWNVLYVCYNYAGACQKDKIQVITVKNEATLQANRWYRASLYIRVCQDIRICKFTIYVAEETCDRLITEGLTLSKDDGRFPSPPSPVAQPANDEKVSLARDVDEMSSVEM